MGLLDIVFAKLFQEYQRKRDNAEIGITLYISIVYFLLTFCLFLPLTVAINKIFFNNEFRFGTTTAAIIAFSYLGLITFLTHKIYIKNQHILRLTKKYKSTNINITLVYLFVILIPPTLLLLAGAFTVLLNGGHILGREFNGLISR